jgi:hypothetical protein
VRLLHRKQRRETMWNQKEKNDNIVIYGAETWSLYEDGRRRINATEMDALTL